MNSVDEWESLTSAERTARLYHYAALASPTWAREIDQRLIPVGIALREAFETVERQDAEKNKNAIKEDHNVTRMIDDNGQVWKFHPLFPALPDPPGPFSITQRDWDTLMLKLDKLICAVLNTTEAIEEGQRVMLPLMGWEPPPEPIRTPITVLAPLPIKTIRALKRSGITTVEEVLARSPKQLRGVRGFGPLTVAKLEALLESKGYSREA